MTFDFGSLVNTWTGFGCPWPKMEFTEYLTNSVQSLEFCDIFQSF